MAIKTFTPGWVKAITWEKARKEIGREAPQYDYFDGNSLADGVRLGLRVGKRRKAWFAMYKNKQGEKKRFTLKNSDMGYAAAREEAYNKIVIETLGGKDPAAIKQKDKSAPTFSTLTDTYLDKYAKRHKKSWQEDERIIDTKLKPKWQHWKINEITRADVSQLVEEISETAPIAANRTLALIRKIFNWAIPRPEYEDYLEINPCHLIKAPGKETQRERVLTPDEIKTAWNAYDGLQGDVSAIFKMLFLTAQREIEVLSMRWQDVDLDTGWWTIPAHVAKNKLSHRVPLSDSALNALREQLERSKKKESEWVFPSFSKEGHITNIYRAHYRARDKAKLKDFRIHDIRRTVASSMTGAGIPRLTVSKILNHVEKGVTAVYDRHSYDDEKSMALDTWARKLATIVSGKAGDNVIQMVR